MLEGIGHSLSVVEKIALEPAGDYDGLAHGEGNVAASDENADILLGLCRAYALDIRKGGGGDDELIALGRTLYRLAAYSKPVAVDGNHRQNTVFDLEHGAGVNRTAVIVADGEDALIYHALEHTLLYGVAFKPVHGGKLRVLAAVHAHEGKLGLAAFYRGHVLIVGND